ncbi:enoyl-CoA hydratase/isomerase family protein [Yoonia sp. SS1-5]|uniref:3-hydroxyisobutyryl-CoA hydrolase n=1 Tax=Yoonia rhodophyticola TaxID=3137370 RepID=A0AAN0MEN0_9RHOB
MTDLISRKTGRAGHITLNRPKALNALSWDMCLAIEACLDAWRDDPEVAVVMIDGAGDRAFCSGGDIAEMYATARNGDYAYGQRFWRDEYRLNAKIAEYNKPVVTFLQGFTMGGGVGVGCHGSHRIVCDSSQIAMPECSIGLVPDVGGSLLLAGAPGFCGTYLGLTGARMTAGDAIFAGFADHYLPEEIWPELQAELAKTGDISAIPKTLAPESRLAAAQPDIDAAFGQAEIGQILTHLAKSDAPILTKAADAMARNAPLALHVALDIITAVRQSPDIRTALDHEFRYTFRCGAQGDFVEGIRAAIIDRDRNPSWRHSDPRQVPQADILHMTAPLGEDALQWEDQS